MTRQKYLKLVCPQGPAENIFEGLLAVRMDLTKKRDFYCPHGPDENILEGLLAVRMDPTKIFLKVFLAVRRDATKNY